MKILFVISLVSFCVLAWAAFSIARHVRGHAVLPLKTPKTVPAARGKRPAKTRRRKPLRIAA